MKTIIHIPHQDAPGSPCLLRKERKHKRSGLRAAIQVLLFLAVLASAVLVSYTIYKDIRQVYASEPAGAGITCFYELLDLRAGN